ncbi:chemotaxis protein [Campylobacter sputorum subsp. bubulus]|uniref:Chemotaxis protein n=1 Tax=Campylobacter sputorum subsp. sputorum TaxID=32024 RepID=A0A381DI58_9BACT|nr:chemotaxis protein [Campylobacter sputorum]ASM35437.1 hypothetical protein CSPUT_1239 [Campylobacter sputorum aubsp. sputorum RM3237]KAB0582824.1 chemotaxis protein [Campylobacter sputorum subsp. sputorum]QEL05629.1 hypothetical protein CSPT_1237 [Campylobacter sputorum subsp. sputorum]SUX08487.1 chemotaxis protein [Campylobacter sputorum subsp. bubulus]SUX10394.1 chemotaxis protein [Campylobacter sputorum subsp. sputorum]
MTQEELDALMSGGLDDVSLMDEETKDDIGDNIDEENIVDENEQKDSKNDDGLNSEEAKNYKISSTSAWPPPPPTEDHKMVKQLDDVTKDSEVKATEMFDKLETITNFCADAENSGNSIIEGLDYNIELFTTLCEKFPNVETFKEALEKNNNLKADTESAISNLQMGQDEIMMIMDMMQYQDIHRQKIERVINVMRALSKYMSSLFEGSIDDEKRVGSAIHIQGDTETENVVSNEDIEALIESLTKK